MSKETQNSKTAKRTQREDSEDHKQDEYETTPPKKTRSGQDKTPVTGTVNLMKDFTIGTARENEDVSALSETTETDMTDSGTSLLRSAVSDDESSKMARLEEENAQLKLDNERLKVTNKQLQAQCDMSGTEIQMMKNHIEVLEGHDIDYQERIKKLNETIKSLSQTVRQLSDIKQQEEPRNIAASEEKEEETQTQKTRSNFRANLYSHQDALDENMQDTVLLYKTLTEQGSNAFIEAVGDQYNHTQLKAIRMMITHYNPRSKDDPESEYMYDWIVNKNMHQRLRNQYQQDLTQTQYNEDFVNYISLLSNKIDELEPALYSRADIAQWVKKSCPPLDQEPNQTVRTASSSQASMKTGHDENHL